MLAPALPAFSMMAPTLLYRQITLVHGATALNFFLLQVFCKIGPIFAKLSALIGQITKWPDATVTKRLIEQETVPYICLLMHLVLQIIMLYETMAMNLLHSSLVKGRYSLHCIFAKNSLLRLYVEQSLLAMEYHIKHVKRKNNLTLGQQLLQIIYFVTPFFGTQKNTFKC